MKKVLSIILVLTMLLGIVAVGTSATVSKPEKTEYGYQNVEAHYFGGELSLNWLFGRASLSPANKDSKCYEGVELIREGDPDNGSLIIDGKLSDGEWGDPVVIVDSHYAASNMNARGELLNYANKDLDGPSAENTFYYNNGNRAPVAGLNFEMYLMWDEDYFYVAVKSNDPDGAKQVNTSWGIWDGDAVQIRIDPMGPNATQNGERYRKETIKYNDVAGWQQEYYTLPWTGSEPTIISGYPYTPYADLLFSYVTTDGGRTEAWDAQNRWNPTWLEYDYENSAGETAHWAGYTYGSEDISILSTNEEIAEDPCYAVVRWDNLGTAKERNDVAVYEMAIPWNIICRDICPDYVAEAGNVLGMSAALMDAATLNTPAGPATDGYTSYLSWGSGIAGYQIDVDPDTTAGNNAVTLSAESYKEYELCDHTFAPADCLYPDTCTKCGYQRGYKVGHKYIFENPILPSTTKDGSITNVCTVCGYTEDHTFKCDGNKLYFDYNENSGNPVNVAGLGSGYCNNWYDDIASAESRKMLYNLDGTSKTSWDTTTFGYSVFDFATTGEGLIYSNGDPAVISPDIHPSTPGGTYFELSKGINAKESGFSFDFYVTDWALPEYHSYYTAGLYSMFGGSTGTSYGAGIYVSENWMYLAIGKYGNLDTCLAVTAEDFEDRAIASKPIDETLLTPNEWHTINFLYDSDDGIMMIFIDGEFQLGAQNEFFKNEMSNGLPYHLLRRFETPFYMKNVRLATAGWTVENYNLKVPGSADSYTLTVDGAETQVAAGETVTLNAAAFQSGKRFGAWLGDIDVLTDNVCDATFTMPDHDVTLTSKYFLVGDANDDGKINAQDANYLSQIIVGGLASVSAADINADGKVNATDSNLLTKMITGTYAPTK